MKLLPLKKILSSSKEKLDEALAPLRERQAKARAETQKVRLEEEMISLERSVQEACTRKEIDFDRLCELMDRHALTERKAKQLDEILVQLFPSEAG